MLARVFARLRDRLRGRRVETEVDDELRFHVEMETEANRARGMTPADARRVALRDLGGVTQTREAVREVRSLGLGTVPQDLRLAVRRLRREPGFTVAAIFTLALGIGANTAGISIIHGLTSRSIPGVAERDRLVSIDLPRADRRGFGSFDEARIGELASLNRTFAAVAGFSEAGADVSIDAEPVRAKVVFVTSQYFDTLGVVMARGRSFSRDAVGAREAVISDVLWRDRFGRRDVAIGAGVLVNGHPFTVAGVAPRGFVGVEAMDIAGRELPHVWVPAGTETDVTGSRGRQTYDPVARLQPGVALDEARAAMFPLVLRWGAEREENVVYRAQVAPVQGEVPWAALRRMLALLAVPGIVLLVACSNLGSLLLARGVGRTQEVAMRRALGAGRWDIVRERLVEALLLAAAGGAAGLVLAYWASYWFIASLRLATVPLTPDLTIVAATAAVCLIAVALSALAPAVIASRPTGLAIARTAGPPPRRARLQKALVVAQVALSLMVLAAGAAILQTIHRLSAGMRPGFDVSPAIVSASIDLDAHPYDRDSRRIFLDDVRSRVGALADVEAVAIAEVPPFVRRLYFGFTMDEGKPRVAGVRVSRDYFRTIGVPLLRGREFGREDVDGALLVAVVTPEMIGKFWPDRDPIGQTFVLNTSGAGGRRDAIVTVVGVAGDVELRDRRPSFYLPLDQHMVPGRGGGWEQLTLLVRGRGDNPPAWAGVREAVRQLDSRLSLFDVTSVRALADGLTERERQISVAITALGVITLVLAAGGTFGVMALTVAQRRRESGIRIALGARPADLTWLRLREGGRLAAVGLALGTGLAVAATRLLASMILPGAPIAAGAAAFVFALVAATLLLACYLPARRAARVDPVTVLAAE